MGHHQVYQHIHNGSPRRRGERGTERIFEGIRAENFPNLHIQEVQQISRRVNTKRSTLGHLNNKTIKRQRDNFEISKRELNHHVQGILNKINRQISQQKQQRL